MYIILGALIIVIVLVTFFTERYLIIRLKKTLNSKTVLYFNESFGRAATLLFMCCAIAVLCITIQQVKKVYEIEVFYSFIILIPALIFNLLVVIKALVFKIEIKKNSIFIRSSFGITRQFAYSKLQYKRKWHILLILYYEGKKYIYFANEVLTPGIDDIYVKLKNLDHKTSI